MKKVLLLVEGLFGDYEVGEKFIASMLATTPDAQIVRFSIVAKTPESIPAHIGYRCETAQYASKPLPLLSSLGYWRFQKTICSQIVEQIETLIKKEQIDCIWALMNGLCVTQVLHRLSLTTKLPYVLQVWDAPPYLANAHRLDPFTKADFIQKFDATYRRAAFGAVMSKGMSRLYQSRYGVQNELMVYCPPTEVWRPAKINEEHKGIIKIVFAGSLYAYKEWQALLDAIEMYHKSKPTRPIEVVCLGTASRWSKKRDWVTYHPHMPVNEAATIVNSCDIAYLPYWMSKKYAHAVQTAFPSKMSFYTACGTPILYHGPENSTPTEFLKEHPVGLSCNSVDAQHIIKTIKALVSTEFLASYPVQQQKTLNDVFHPRRIADTFQGIVERVCSE